MRAAALILLLCWTLPAAAGGILVMGDSISAAYGVPTGRAWVDLLAARLLEEGLKARVVNASVSGETTQGGLARLGGVLDRHAPDIVILELGGNDAMVVAADANLKAAARTAVWAGMFNAGQTCVGVERIYVVGEAYEPFIAELDKAIRDVDAGSGGRGDIGPIIHPPQIDLIESHVREAVAKGGRILRGGERVDRAGGIYYQPTVLLDVDHSMEVMRHETFGPVIAVMRVPDEETALELAGDSYHGLHGSVWSRDRKRARRLASQLETGSVAINDHTLNFLYPSIQLAGAKESGYGGQMGPTGIRSYCHPKGITVPRGRVPTTWLLRARLPRAAGTRYWKALARSLFGR